METITVEVAGKFGPKSNGKWYGVKRPLKATDFVAGQTYEIETEDWSSNGKSGVNITSSYAVMPESLNKQTVKTQNKPKVEISRVTVLQDIPTTTAGITSPILTGTLSYEDQKNRRILRQGVVQAVAQSPLLAGLPFANANEAVALIKEVSNQLIEFVQE